MTYQPQNRNLTTGVISGCVVSINADTSKFDVTAGTVVIEDWSNPLEMRLKQLTYPGVTGQTPPNPTTNVFTSLALIEGLTAGVADLQMTSQGEVDTQTRREQVALVGIIHPLGDGVITIITEDYQIAFGWQQALNDMTQCRKACVDGNLISANGANLSIDRAAGTTSLPFFNASNSQWLSPTMRDNVSQTIQPFVKQAQAPAGPFVGVQSTLVDPDNYDNAGVITALANNKWTIQRVYLFGQSTTVSIAYGQTIYSSQSAAEAAVESETFIDQANTLAGVWICSLVLKKGTTDLSNTSDNTIVNRG